MRKKLLLGLLLACCSIGVAIAQSVTITGKVTGDKGAPLAGVTVQEKNSKIATVSDDGGLYRISVKSGATLVFSSVGYKKAEFTVNGTTLNVSLKQEDASLSEVVVTSFGQSSSKKRLSSSVVDVKADQLAQKSEPDILRALQGKVPGVTVVGGGGAPGQSSKINIRGITSFSGNNQPLIVVDGIPFDNSVNQSAGFDANTVFSNRLYDVDPNNIESMTILKGANAAALYGSGAQNGAIIITTKTGNTKKARGLEVTYNSSYSIENVSNTPEYQDVYGQGSNGNYNGGFIGNWGSPFGAYRDQVNASVGYERYTKTQSPMEVAHPLTSLSYTIPRYNAAFPELVGVMVPYKAYDIVGGFFKQGTVAENSININSSTGKTGINGGFSRMDNVGIVPNSKTERTSLSFGGNSTLNNGLVITGNVNYVKNFQNSPQSGASYFADYGPGEGFSSIYARLYYLPRNYNLNAYPFETPEGNNVFYRALDNPYWIAKYNTFTSEVNRVFGNLSFSYDINSKINLFARGGINTYTDHQTNYLRPGGTSQPVGRYQEADFTNETLNYTFLATYKTDINKDIDVKWVVGADYLQKYNRYMKNTGIGVIDPAIRSLKNTATVTNDFNGFEKSRKMGLLTDLQLGFRNYLFMNVTGRNDWSSTLPSDNRSYFFPSVGLGFVFTELVKLPENIINYGKLRVSGVSVAGDASPYQLQTIYSVNPIGAAYANDGGTKFNYATLGNEVKNAFLKPEITSEIEAGLELRMFKNKVNFDLTLFRKRTKDQIIAVSSPRSTGFSSRVVNAGEVENKGIELGITTTNIQTTDFKWTTNINFNLIRSMVLDAGPTGEIFLGGSGFSSLGTIIRKGEPFGMIFGSRNARAENGALLIDKNTGLPFTNPDSEIIGNPNPDFTLGFINNFSYKGFSVSALLDYRHGGDMYSVTAASLLLRGQLNNEYAVDREGVRIIPGVYGDPGTYAAVKDASGNQIKNTTPMTAFDYHFSDGYGAYGADETNVYDVTTIRLREVTLGYELPRDMLKKTPFGTARLSLTGRNLWFKAPNVLKGLNFDPEVLSSVSTSNVQGFDFGASPTTKRFGINLTVTF